MWLQKKMFHENWVSLWIKNKTSQNSTQVYNVNAAKAALLLTIQGTNGTEKPLKQCPKITSWLHCPLKCQDECCNSNTCTGNYQWSELFSRRLLWRKSNCEHRNIFKYSNRLDIEDYICIYMKKSTKQRAYVQNLTFSNTKNTGS